MNVRATLDAIARDHEPTGQTATRTQMCHAPIHPTHVETDVAAAMLLVDPDTLRKSHSQKGAYCGIRPVRLPSRKLAWPLVEIERLLNPNEVRRQYSCTPEKEVA